MSAFSALHGALSGHLGALGLDLPVAWENLDYRPHPGRAYLAESFMPATSRSACLGPESPDRVAGLYQVDVVCPAGGGWGESMATVDQVAGHFSSGTVLAAGGWSLTIDGSCPAAARHRDGWMIISVTVRWTAFVGDS